MEVVFYVFNILLCVWLILYYPFFLSRKLNVGLFNPITIPALCNFPVVIAQVLIGPAYFLEEGLLNPYYNFALFTTNVDYISRYILTIVGFMLFRKNESKITMIVNKYNTKWKVKKNKMILVSLFFFFLAIFSFLLLSSHSFGVWNWINDPRTGYQYHRVGGGQYYAFFLLFLSTSYSILLLYIKRNSIVLFSYFSFMFVVWLLGSKGHLLTFSIYTFIILWFRQYRYIDKVIKFFLPLIFGLMILNLGKISFVEIVSYFDDFYVNSAKFFEEYFNDRIELFYGKVWFSQFWDLVPRALYRDKPYVYGIILINEYFFPGAAEASHTPVFSGPIMAFADFGLLGVFLNGIFNFSVLVKILAYKIILNKFSFDDIRSRPIRVYIFILLFAPGFLTFFSFPWSLLVFIFLVKNISFINRAVCKMSY